MVAQTTFEFNYKIIKMKSQNRLNYGALTDFSKALNDMVGDKTGRTVSHRTASGLKKIFKVEEMSNDDAEHIVHAGMAAAGILVSSKDENLMATGALLGLGLFICYQEGKRF